MNSKSFLTRILMIAMLAFVAVPAAVFAQDRYPQDNSIWNRNQDRDRRDRDDDREGWRRGRDGRWERVDDRWDNNRRNRRYNRNDDGYNDDGYSNFGGSIHLRQTALNAGFADGVKEGRKDRSKNERFDFRDENNFQKASRDYSSRLGDRGLYATYYRQAFENGYRDGFAGY
ncbi:MAG: hypothetical protein AABN95_06000 [Acidobacteriota bacterium]